MVIVGKVIFSLFIGVLISIIIKKTANYLAARKTSKNNIYPGVVFNNKLYGGTIPNSNLLEWNETDAWVEVAPQHESETYLYSLAMVNGKLYGGTYPNGNLVAWNETDAWVEAALQHESETHNGGTQPDNKTFNTDERINVSQIDEEND